MFDALKGKVFFHGRLPENELAEILNITHIVVSPNRVFAANPNDFDGFPLASSVTAGYFNNAMIMTDSLEENQNNYFLEGKDFLKIIHHSNDICEKLEYLDDNRFFLEEMAMNGRKRIEELYSWEAQIKPRIELFKKLL